MEVDAQVCFVPPVCDRSHRVTAQYAAAKSFMDGLDDTIRSVEAAWQLPGAIKSRGREMLAFPDEGGKFPRDPMVGLDKDLTAQAALRVRISCTCTVLFWDSCGLVFRSDCCDCGYHVPKSFCMRPYCALDVR